MRHAFRLVMASIVASAATIAQASAGEWGCCAARKTYVVSQYIDVGPYPRIWRGLSNGHLVNQGQFDTDDATIPARLYHQGYVPGDLGYVFGVQSRFYPYYGYGFYWLPASPIIGR
jgi:hypothetical protein